MGTTGSGEWRRSWKMLVPSCAGVMLASVPNYSLGVMMMPLEQEYGWSRAEIASGSMIISCVVLIGNPLAGILIDRFGPRRIALLGTLIFCSALAFVSTAGPDLMSWWIRWLILGATSSLVLAPVWLAAVNSCFEANRGKALALAMCGTGIGAAIVPGITSMLIGAWSWQGAYVGLALLMAAIVTPLVFLLFFSPIDRLKSDTQQAAPQAASGLSASEGFRSSKFYMLAVAVLIFGLTSCALSITAVPVLTSKGLDLGTAASLAGLIGAGSVLGRLGGGFLLDIFDARKVAAACITAPVISVALLLVVPESTIATAAACLLLGLSLGAEVDACAYLAARHFGMRGFGVLFGTINGLSVFGAGAAPMAANHVFDLWGTYDPVLLTMVPACLLSAMLFLGLGRYPVFAGAPSAPQQERGNEPRGDASVGLA